MKKIFILIIPFLFSCTQENKNEVKELSKQEFKTQSEYNPNKKDLHKDGEFVSKHPNGVIYMKGEYKNGVRIGQWDSYYETGKLWSEMFYDLTGKKSGPNVVFYENGNKRYEGNFLNDEQVGTWSFYDESGKLVKKVNFDKKK